MHNALKDAARPLDSNEREVLRQLFFQGPTWDGDVVSKVGRDGLVDRGLAVRREGWQMLSEAGFVATVEAGYGDQKEAWDARRRARQ